MAESVGFEPTEPVKARFLSRELVSTTHPTLFKNGGKGGIRTHGAPEGSAVFKTAAISQTLPPFHWSWILGSNQRPTEYESVALPTELVHEH